MTQATTTIATRNGTVAPPLREFLAAHDADCPACGYNLRGNTAGSCPECGREVRLGLLATDALTRRQGLLLLLFLWLLLAGLMNAVRTGREIHVTASRVSVQQLLATLPMPAPLSVTAGDATPRFVWRDLRVDAAATGPGRLQFNLAPGTAATRNWANVSWRQWSRFAGWTTLGALAVTGLVLLWHGHRGAASPRLATTLLALAWTGFGGYFAYHSAVFVMELL